MFQVSSTFGEWGGWQEVDKEMSVTSSAVSTTDLVVSVKYKKALPHLNPYHDDDVDEDTTDLVSAVESSPSASPLANDLRAGGPGGEGGAGGIPGT